MLRTEILNVTPSEDDEYAMFLQKTDLLKEKSDINIKDKRFSNKFEILTYTIAMKSELTYLRLIRGEDLDNYKTGLYYNFTAKANVKLNSLANLDTRSTLDHSKEQDMHRIREFLLNKDAVVAQLIKLEKQLKKHITSLSFVKLFQPKRDVSAFKQYKMLSSFLYKWATANGFASSTTITDSLTSDAFLQVLANGQLFKDSALGNSQHGEWTHFLQWWCVVEANKEKPFLMHSPVQLLEWLGQPSNVEWLYTFEFNRNAPTYHYRHAKHHALGDSVFGFNRYFFSQEGERAVPLLSELIVARYKRRLEKQDESNFKMNIKSL